MARGQYATRERREPASARGCGTSPRPRKTSGRILAAVDRAHVAVIAAFGDAEPGELVVAELLHAFVDLLEGRVLGAHFFVQLDRFGVARVHHRLGERLQLGALRDQAAQRGRVLGVVLGDHVVGRRGRGLRQDGLVLLGQLVVGVLVDVERHLQRAFPPARIVVVRGDLVEAQLFVIVGADPFGRVDGALFQRGVDVAAGDLLRHDAQAREHGASKGADTELQALQIVDGLDFLAEPAAHLRAGVAAREVDDVVGLEDFAHQRQAVAVTHPGIHLARVQAERHGRVKAQDGVLAVVVVRRAVAAFDRAVLDAVQHLQGRDDFACGKHADGKFSARGFRHVLGDAFATGKDGIRATRKTGRQAPVQGGGLLGNGGRRQGRAAGGSAQGGFFQKGTALHLVSPTLGKVLSIPGRIGGAPTRDPAGNKLSRLLIFGGDASGKQGGDVGGKPLP